MKFLKKVGTKAYININDASLNKNSYVLNQRLMRPIP